jgi:hypothetical protein
MAVFYCVTVSIILFHRYENGFVLMQFGRSRFKIPHGLFHGSSACRKFPKLIDFYRELGVQRSSVISTVLVICGEYRIVVVTVICGVYGVEEPENW